MTATIMKFDKQLLDISRRRSVRPTSNIGTNGAVVFNGFLQTNEKDGRLRDRQKFVTFSQMLENCLIIGASVRYVLNLVEKPEWAVKPADDSDQAKVFAERVEVIMNSMDTPFPELIRKSTMFKYYGFDAQEWVAKQLDEGYIGFRDIEARPQETIRRWDIDDKGRLKGVIQRNPKTLQEVYIPRTKLIYSVDHSLTSSPEGLGLLRHCVAGWNRLKQYELLEGVGYETDLRGIPIARAPLGALTDKLNAGTLTADQFAAFKKPLEDIIANHFNIQKNETGLLLDSSVYSTTDGANRPSTQPLYDFELVRGGADGQQDLNVAIARVKHEIADVLGTSVLLLGTTQGSFALSRDKSNNLFQLITSIIMQLARTYNNDFIGTIWKLNGWPDEFRPTFVPESISIRDIEDITKSLDNLAKAGATIQPDDPVINDIRRALGVSQVPKEIMDRAIENAEAALNNITTAPDEGTPASKDTTSESQT